jgi:dimethylhistidine N-methyltransferase
MTQNLQSEQHCVEKNQAQKQLTASLGAMHAYVSPKYLYDALGSRLFELICEVPEYYLTRTEAMIFSMHEREIAEAVGQGAALIDLGAGNCRKAANLFASLEPKQYVAIDISTKFLQEAVDELQQKFPKIEMTCLGMDFSSKLKLPSTLISPNKKFFYPGSSIGNFSPPDAIAFLRQIPEITAGEGGGLLIGIDLIKDHSLLTAAYDDSLGITSAFNLNLLNHLNRLLDADFQPIDWCHRAFYNSEQCRVEMHLEARRELTVHWDGGGRSFTRGQTIHTESSYKYTHQSFVDMLQLAGFGEVKAWFDPKKLFMVCYAR